MKQEAGFTLIEVLVAMAITVFIGTMAYLTFQSSMDAGERSGDRAERLNEIDRAMRMLERDLTQLVARPISDSYGEWRDAFVGQQHSGYDDENFYLLQLTRDGWQNPQEQLRSELQRVGYRLQDGNLWRDYWTQLDGAEPESLRPLQILSGVTEWRVRFLTNTGGNKNELGGRWVERWPINPTTGAGASEQLPVAVELIVILEDWGEIRRLFSLS